MVEKAGIYEISVVLNWADLDVNNEIMTKQFDGKLVLSSLLNYKLFAQKGCDCIVCGAKGSHFVMERTKGYGRSLYHNWHFNLYAVNSGGKLVMMTKDHKIPKSGGGTDDLDNLQPMCAKCNTKKGSLKMEVFLEKVAQSKTPKSNTFGRTTKIKKYNNDESVEGNTTAVFGKSRGRVKRKGDLLTEEDYAKTARTVMEKMRDRCGVTLTEAEYQLFIEDASVAKPVHWFNGKRSIRQIRVKGTDILAVYSNSDKMVYSVKPISELPAILRQVPVWGRGKETECLKMYDEIRSTATGEMKVMESSRATFEYIQTCTYPVLMKMLWRKAEGQPFDESMFSITIWKIIEEKIKP